MSVLIPAVSSSGLQATTNLSNPQSFTKMIWCKFGAQPVAYNPIMSAYNSAVSAYEELYANSSLHVHSTSTDATFATQPTWTDWTCYALTGTTAAAGSLIAYQQDNAGGGFVSANTTGVAVTVASDRIATGGNNQTMTVAFYKEWNVVLTPTQLQAEFLSAAPVITGASLRRYLALTNAATAGTDSSGNTFNMTAVGTLSDGTGLPTFPSTVNFRKTLSRLGGRVGARQVQ